MKKRILLSMVSLFVMTTMWASLLDAYQIYVTAGANGKTNAEAVLTLNMKNKSDNQISVWQCVLELPEGVTFKQAAIVEGRYPEGYNAKLTSTVNGDGTVTISCSGDGDVTLTGTDGAVATVTVEIAGTVEPGDHNVVAKSAVLTEPNGDIHEDQKGQRTFVWTIEQGEAGVMGDLNNDGGVDIADAVTVLNIMASGSYVADADLNKDGKVDIADYITVLNIMAAS